MRIFIKNVNLNLFSISLIFLFSSFEPKVNAQDIRINEFMALNQTTIADQDGDYSDWIEIYNSGASTVNLAGWSLTDDKTIIKKWIFPSVQLASGGYLLVFASGKNRVTAGSQLHTNFKLSGSGEYLALSNPEGSIISEFDPSFPALETDVSYGYFEGAYVKIMDPSPGAAMSGTALTLLPAPVFDKSHGFYDSTFSLSITCGVTSAQIYYTTDGSVPSKTNGSFYTAPLNITTTSIIRAIALADGQEDSKVTTCTYLFLDDVIHQPNNPDGYPTEWGKYYALSGNAIADYEMDPEMIEDSAYAASVKEALKDIPTVSLVTDKDNLFSNVEDEETGGIYIFTGPPLSSDFLYGPGKGWERPASFEYFADDDSTSLQIDCGVRLQGGHSRRPEKSPKHSFRVVFRNKYGTSELDYPLFGESEISTFNTITMRAGFCNSWIHHEDEQRDRSQYLRDTWAKDVQKAMGNTAANNNFAHLYLNGMYWGLYNLSERIDKRFAESYLRGDEDDFDVIKDYTEVVDGNLDAWNSMMEQANAGLTTTAALQKIQGNHEDGSPNGEYEKLLDIENFMDYMILNLYGGNTDWDHHNWAAIRNRERPGKGFQFISWDAEHVLKDVHENVLSKNNRNCPSRIFQKLMENAEFRRLFADRVMLHCSNGGVLTPERAKSIWEKRSLEIEDAVLAEAARWGDYRRDVHQYQTYGPFELYTKETHWLPQQDFMYNTYFPERTAAFLAWLENYGWISPIVPPIFMINDGPIVKNYVDNGDMLSMSTESGVIYYTTDGSDPADWNDTQESGVINILAANADKKVLVPKSDIGDVWLSDVDFDDSGWTSCSGGSGFIGYEKGDWYGGMDFSLDVGNDMYQGGSNPNTSCYVRVKFTLTQGQLDSIGTLMLPNACDNGFAAYVNGVLATKKNVTLPLSWNSVSNRDIDMDRVEMYDISSVIDSLVVGENILAIQGVNYSTSSLNFLVYFGLFGRDKADNGEVASTAQFYSTPIEINSSKHIKARAYKNGVWSPMTEKYFIIPSELNDLKVTEVNFHPHNNIVDTIDGDRYEFIELKNTGSSTLYLDGLKFEKGIDYEFGPKSEIGPGGFIVLAEHNRYFYNRYGITPFDEYSGQLDNDGERIIFTAINGDTIGSFKYNDNSYWPDSIDGDGHSLVPTEYNPTNNQDSSIYWRASFEIGGSPGADDIEGVNYLIEPLVGIEQIDIKPVITNYSLDQNYPNPFSELTYIHYKLADMSHVKLSIVNIMGQEIKTLVNERQYYGHQLVTWDCTDNSNNRVKAGVYFYRLEISNSDYSSAMTKKMIVTD